MPSGRVKWFSDLRGYGFITGDEGGSDLFVHYTGIAGDGRRSLQAGARVSFEIREGRKGPEAFDVRPLGVPARPAPTEESLGRPRKRLRLPRRHGVR
jgi:CspA family cold shock protein